MDASARPSAPILRLRTFGGALLEGPRGLVTGAISQRRRLAVLSLLASSGGGISRDRLVGLLWPESVEEKARHALSQLLHGLRRELGDDVIAGSATSLQLNPDVVASDVHEFATALASGDHARVAALYQGVFLEGFYLNGCPDFERWVEEKRAALAQQAEEAIEKLAKSAAADGNTIDAVEWWRRVAVLRPLDSRIALALMQATVAAGDRAGALQHARLHEALLRNQLDAALTPEIAAYVEALRAEPPPAVAPVLTAPTAPTVRSPTAPLSPAASTVSGSALRRTSAPARISTPSTVFRQPRRSRLRMGGIAVACTAVLGAALMLGLRATESPASAGQQTLIIADVENATGDSVFDRTVPVALAAALAQSPRIRVVSPERIALTLVRMRRAGPEPVLTEKLAREIAQRDGVPVVAVPTINRAENSYELTTRILDGSSGAVLGFSTVRAAGRPDVLDALDRLGRQLRRKLGESGRSVRGNSVALPLVTTASLEALKKYADGERAFRSARPEEARVLWTQAVTIDTAFAIAYANLGMLHFRNNKPAAGDSLYARAFAHLAPLPEREQIMIRASALSWQGDHAGAVKLLTPYLAQHPDDYGALRTVAYEYFRMRRSAEAVAAFTKVLAVDSLDYTVWINLASSEKQLGHLAESLRAYRRAFALAPMQMTANDNLNLEFASTFVMAGQPDSAAGVIAALAAAPDPLRHARALRSMAFLAAFRGNYSEASSDLTQAVALTRSAAEGTSEIRNRLLLATVIEERGHTREAARELDSAYAVIERIDAEPTLLYWVGKAFARAGDVTRASRLLARLETTAHPNSATDRGALEALRGEVLVAKRQTADGLAHLQLASQADPGQIVLESLAYGTATSGDLASAAPLYARLGRGIVFGSEAQHSWRLAPYWLARVQERAGNTTLARAGYERFIASWPRPDADLRSVSDARERVARLLARERGG
jgi:DNA-binding SARP family transcriptional activator/Tfp pilus assembly protein PilF